MNYTPYTPGEWIASEAVASIPITISSEDKYPIARVYTTIQDAKLMAAAKDMHEALFQLVVWIKGGYKPDKQELYNAVKALAKAEGK